MTPPDANRTDKEALARRIQEASNLCLTTMEDIDPDLAAAMKVTTYTPKDMTNLTNKAVEELLAEVGEDDPKSDNYAGVRVSVDRIELKAIATKYMAMKEALEYANEMIQNEYCSHWCYGDNDETTPPENEELSCSWCDPVKAALSSDPLQ